MRRNSILFLAVLFIFISACDLLKKEEVVILSDRLSSSSKSGMNFDNPSMAKQLSEAQVEGTVQNVSDKTLKNIVITYKIGRKSVTAEIASLKPNQKANFKTTKHKSNKTAPKYKLESITYNE
jgi:hypothetical protein